MRCVEKPLELFHDIVQDSHRLGLVRLDRWIMQGDQGGSYSSFTLSIPGLSVRWTRKTGTTVRQDFSIVRAR